VLAKLGAPLLQRHGGASDGGCPGADIVAGYLDRTLDNAERARCEEHFAACARCQDVLAAFARTETEAPVAQVEASPARLWSEWLRWQWLAPAAAVLAVGLVWTLVKPTVGPITPPASEPPVVLQESPAVDVGGRAAAEDEARKAANQAARSDKGAALGGTLAQSARMQAESKESLAAPPQSRSKREVPAPAPAAPATAQNLAVAPSKDVRGEPVPVQKTVDAAKPAAAPPAAERAVLEQRAVAAGAAGARVMAMADTIQPETVVQSPSPRVAWRFGPAGAIERSVDGRRTWEKQDSAVTVNLLAGSAPSESVCWIVGQRGTVLRTTDGGKWETMSPPAAVDLVAVSARDGLAATVVAADGRRFTTTDGGRTWQGP
jgi:hypothetical protein